MTAISHNGRLSVQRSLVQRLSSITRYNGYIKQTAITPTAFNQSTTAYPDRSTGEKIAHKEKTREIVKTTVYLRRVKSCPDVRHGINHCISRSQATNSLPSNRQPSPTPLFLLLRTLALALPPTQSLPLGGAGGGGGITTATAA